MNGTVILIELAGHVGLLLWGTHMVGTGVQRGFGPVLRRWLETADARVNNVLYLEQPDDRLVRLVGPLWVDGRVRATLQPKTESPKDAAPGKTGAECPRK